MPRLHLDRLECQTTVRDLRAALKSLPTKIDETYDDAMARIQNQVPEYSQLAMSALSWISNALRPLKWSELQHALAIRRGDQNIDEEALVDETLLISVSAGLITLDSQSETIRLAHFTVEEYFKREKQAWFPKADTQIAEICLIYLSFDVFKIGPCSSQVELESRLRQNCLLKYASQNWGHHTLRADEHIDEDIAVRFLTNDRMVSCCDQAKLYQTSPLNSWRKWRISNRKIAQSSGLHLAAQFRLLSVFKMLLKRNNGVPPKDTMDQTPLTIAVIEGHTEMVRFLVGQENVMADSPGEYRRTPLSHAASKGHTEIVKLLLARDGVIVDFRDIDGRTPLSYAASRGFADIVKLLIARDDVSVNSRDITGFTPLMHATIRGHAEIVKLLVARDGIIVDSRDKDGRTPISYAASYGLDAIVKLLVARGEVIADSRNEYERTPLSYAASEGHAEIVKLLVTRNDVIADFRHKHGRTPLSFAAAYGHEAIVKLLLDRGDVVADSRDDAGRTPLSYAAESRFETVVKLLLGRDDVDVDSRDNNGRTPLSYATRRGHHAVVQLLETKLRTYRADDAAGVDQ